MGQINMSYGQPCLSKLQRTCSDSLGGLYVREGGFAFLPRGLDIEKLKKPPMIYSISYFDLWGLVLCLGG